MNVLCAKKREPIELLLKGVMDFNDLTRLAFKLTKNKEDAEDAVQNALVSFLTYKHHEATDKNLKNKTYQKAIDNYDDNKKHYINRIDLWDDDDIESDWNTDKTENNSVIKKIYKQLTLNEMKILTLLLAHEGNCYWAAENSDYSVSSFKVLLYRLRNRLKYEEFY